MTDAELAILGLLAEGPQHGYQIQRAIELRGVREWTTIGFSSVYYILNKLERDGLLESRLAPSRRGPVRKVYAITQAGQGVLQTALVDLLSTPHDRRSGFILGLANMHLLRPEQVRRALDAYESQLRTRLAELNQSRAAQAESPLPIRAIYDYRLQMTLAELEWLREFRQAWEMQAPPSPPPGGPFRTPVVNLHPTEPAGHTDTLPRPAEAEQEAPPGEEDEPE